MQNPILILFFINKFNCQEFALSIVEILDGLENRHKPQRKFLQALVSTLVVQSAVDFLSPARYSDSG